MNLIDILAYIALFLVQEADHGRNRYCSFSDLRRLAQMCDSLEGELRVAQSRPATVDDVTGGLTQALQTVIGAANLIRFKLRLAEPSSALPALPHGRRPATALETLVESNREAAREELSRVVVQLNRLSSLGIASGPHFEGLHRDYQTLAALIGTQLVHFSVDQTAPPGTRSSRAGYRAGIWIGPASAEHVVVMLPGMGTSTSSWLEQNVADAQRLQATAAALGTGEAVAVVPLLSYQPPMSLLDAPLGRFWEGGAETTADALAGLPLAGRHVVGWGHSYGAAVLGATSSATGFFDDLIMAGAAGTGTESIDELGVTADHLYVATNWNDPIRLVPNDFHGVNPETLPHVDVPTSPSMKLNPIRSILNLPWALATGLPDHSYLDDPIAMRAFAAIAIGLDDPAE